MVASLYRIKILATITSQRLTNFRRFLNKMFLQIKTFLCLAWTLIRWPLNPPLIKIKTRVQTTFKPQFRTLTHVLYQDRKTINSCLSRMLRQTIKQLIHSSQRLRHRIIHSSITKPSKLNLLIQVFQPKILDLWMNRPRNGTKFLIKVY